MQWNFEPNLKQRVGSLPPGLERLASVNTDSSLARRKETEPMNGKLLSIAAAAGLLIGSTAIGYPQNSTRDGAPGQRMQDKGSVPGEPGASGYSPGDRMQDKGSKPGEPGASGYAPGRQGTTGQGGDNRNSNVKSAPK
jgi:hypothetical protein